METTISSSTVIASPLVSVCMITYNQAPYIRQAIEGVLMQQTDFPYELIISDDCSKDETRSICQHYKSLYPDKIRLLFPEKNLGISGNFYGTFNSAIGKYIAFCEGDDYWIDPFKLQRQATYLEMYPNVGCVYTDFNRLNQQSGHIEQSLFQTQPQLFRQHRDLASFICEPLYLAPCTWMFRRELLETHPLSSIDATFVFFSHLLSQTEIHFLSETTAVYRDLPESASHSTLPNKIYARALGLYKTQVALVILYGLSQEEKRQIDESYYFNNLKLVSIFGDKSELINAYHVLKAVKLKVCYRLRLQLFRFQLGRWVIQQYYKGYYTANVQQ